MPLELPLFQHVPDVRASFEGFSFEYGGQGEFEFATNLIPVGKETPELDPPVVSESDVSLEASVTPDLDLSLNLFDLDELGLVQQLDEIDAVLNVGLTVAPRSIPQLLIVPPLKDTLFGSVRMYDQDASHKRILEENARPLMRVVHLACPTFPVTHKRRRVSEKSDPLAPLLEALTEKSTYKVFPHLAKPHQVLHSYQKKLYSYMAGNLLRPPPVIHENTKERPNMVDTYSCPPLASLSSLRRRLEHTFIDPGTVARHFVLTRLEASAETLYEPAYKANPVLEPHNSKMTLGLCPYCPSPSWFLMYNSTYAHHLENNHGIYKSNSFVPDTLSLAKYSYVNTGGKTRKESLFERDGVTCPQCNQIVLFDSKGYTLGSGKGDVEKYIPYLRHYKKLHKTKGNTLVEYKVHDLYRDLDDALGNGYYYPAI
ncbi:hypothetical protein BABINDRAFT_174960 [Babjeviella inositovora NRRL Y-12698]|uniref:Transcription regulator Rua1 C-terminal domain-containing protein n=1 Tax=Babjeviella inositovora NRRL Y-12698 TaxID=984486 RepID=A0A1E3QU13_9ASCO|nr:uncharacterized protein BABINDRAFT_174960 [Babjeviella inositovora NRRL Y-12698]ODQ81181.1 hypothetical protein BABINDRAFT_174960 [Babjeviella inositovora NRRL Y-12698]